MWWHFSFVTIGYYTAGQTYLLMVSPYVAFNNCLSMVTILLRSHWFFCCRSNTSSINNNIILKGIFSPTYNKMHKWHRLISFHGYQFLLNPISLDPLYNTDKKKMTWNNIWYDIDICKLRHIQINCIKIGWK
jgi:hypothetical protein